MLRLRLNLLFMVKCFLSSLLLVCFINIGYAQEFSLRVNSYGNSCESQKEYPRGESILTWKLSKSSAVLYYGTNYATISYLKVVEYEYDVSKNSYVYTYYDEKRKKFGILIYFKNSQSVSMQYLDADCSLNYLIV